MKALSIVVAGILATATLPPAHADELLPTKQGVTFLGSTAAGAALGGPIGLLAGAVVGAFFSESLETASTANENHEQLLVTRSKLEQAELRVQQSNEYMIALQEQLKLTQDASLQYAQREGQGQDNWQPLFSMHHALSPSLTNQNHCWRPL